MEYTAMDCDTQCPPRINEKGGGGGGSLAGPQSMKLYLGGGLVHVYILH